MLLAHVSCVTELGGDIGTATVNVSAKGLSAAGPFALFAEVSCADWTTCGSPFGIGNFSTSGMLQGSVTGVPPRMNCTAWDAAYNSKWQTMLIDTASTVHRLGCSYSGSGAPLAWVDGRNVEYANGGTGTGIIGALPNTISIGDLPVIGDPIIFTLVVTKSTQIKDRWEEGLNFPNGLYLEITGGTPGGALFYQ
jgi:hypothetical protein